MNCPHCGSNYTHYVTTWYHPDKTYEIYACDSCERTFDITLSTWKQRTEGTFLMRFNGREKSVKFNSFTEYAELYLLDDGTILTKTCTALIKNVNDEPDDFHRVIRKRKPRFELWHHYADRPWLKFTSFESLNDPDGTSFIVETIKMNDELTKKALSNEAMRLSYHSGDEKLFIVRGIKSPERIKDMASYLNSMLVPYQEEEKKSGGCYIATAVYGSYNCPEVWTLRRFRDFDLAETWYGRLFIKTYYSISPTLVSWFGNKQWFKSIWRSVLDRMVTNLNEKGVENTPYEDRNW